MSSTRRPRAEARAANRAAQRERRRAASHRRAFPWKAAIGALGLLAVAGAAVVLVRSAGQSGSAPTGLPSPLGGPTVAQDVNTLVGKPAPAFSLSDSEGVRYSVTPGAGKPLVLVSHMGIT